MPLHFNTGRSVANDAIKKWQYVCCLSICAYVCVREWFAHVLAILSCYLHAVGCTSRGARSGLAGMLLEPRPEALLAREWLELLSDRRAGVHVPLWEGGIEGTTAVGCDTRARLLGGCAACAACAARFTPLGSGAGAREWFPTAGVGRVALLLRGRMCCA